MRQFPKVKVRMEKDLSDEADEQEQQLALESAG